MTFKAAPQWSDGEAAQAQAACAAVDVDINLPTWRQRLFLRSDGAWHLQVRYPGPTPERNPTGRPSIDEPWTWGFDWRRYEVRLLPLAEAITLLRGPESPEREMQRRQQLVAKYEAGVAAERAKEEQRKRDEDAAIAARRARERELRIDDWDRHTPVGKVLLRLGVAIRSLAAEAREKDEKLAETLMALAEIHRRLAAEELLGGKQRSGASLGPALPNEVWWA